jgi:hypothetical protein
MTAYCIISIWIRLGNPCACHVDLEYAIGSILAIQEWSIGRTAHPAIGPSMSARLKVAMFAIAVMVSRTTPATRTTLSCGTVLTVSPTSAAAHQTVRCTTTAPMYQHEQVGIGVGYMEFNGPACSTIGARRAATAVTAVSAGTAIAAAGISGRIL